MPHPEDVVGPFSVRQTGEVGQEILDPNGQVIAWTLDHVLAALIATLLTENQEMFIQP